MRKPNEMKPGRRRALGAVRKRQMAMSGDYEVVRFNPTAFVRESFVDELVEEIYRIIDGDASCYGHGLFSLIDERKH